MGHFVLSRAFTKQQQQQQQQQQQWLCWADMGILLVEAGA